MLRWVVCPCQRSLRFRRSIIFAIIIFMITTSFLYTLVEHYTTPNHYINSSSSISVESFSFNSVCQFTNDTIRAINLALSDHCKEKIRDIACQIDLLPDFFPESLPRLCPIQKGHFGNVIGCVSSDGNSKYNTSNVQTFNSDTTCIDYCLKHSVSFAEYNELTGQCLCPSTFDDQQRLITANLKCTEIAPKTISSEKNILTLYQTGYASFGNHLVKRDRIEDNDEFAIVFFLTVGGRKNLRQIKRLLRTIYSKQHYYLIHVDSRENYLYQELLILSEKFSNIHLTNKRYPTTWGASTLLAAHLEAFRELFEKLKWNFSFVLNLSESDFLLKSVQVLTNFLSKYPSYNFLRSHNQQPFRFLKSQGMLHTFIHCDNYMYRISPRPLIQNIIYDGGSDWYVLNREFIHYITYGNDELINGLRHIFNYSLLPCEAFFHTAISNSIYCDTYIRNNLRMVYWDRGRGCKCQHKHVVDWCGCSPVVYRSTDKTMLKDSIDKPLFFARKFDPTIDESILDWIDEKVSKQDLSNGAFYLQNIYHIDDSTTDIKEVSEIIDSFAQTKLIEYRRNCFHDVTVRLQQIHLVYHLSIFQGYSLQYQVNDSEQWELFVRLNSLGARRSSQVKRFEVGQELDAKESLFIDRSRMFIGPKLVKALIEWESMTDNDTSLVISSPSGAILQQVKLLPSNESLIIDIFFPVISSTSLIGVWQMSIVNETDENILASLTFLVLPSTKENLLHTEYSTVLTSFWSITNICSAKSIDSSRCGDISNQTKFTITNNCAEQRWSVFFFDIKSDW